MTFDNINSMINFAVIIADPLRAVYIGSEPATQKITGSCPFIIISLVSHFSSLNGYSFQAIYPCTQPIQLLLIACLDSSSA